MHFQIYRYLNSYGDFISGWSKLATVCGRSISFEYTATAALAVYNSFLLNLTVCALMLVLHSLVLNMRMVT